MSNIYKTFGIYRITNTLNGKSYIGKTGMNFGDRWDSHRAKLNGGYHDNPHLQRAWDKYGQDAFEFEIVEEVSDLSLLNDLEKKYIERYRENNICYNILDGGDGGFLLGCHLSEETKRKIGEKNRVNMTGRKASDETRQKMSQSQKQRYASWTEEDRAEFGRRMSERASGYKWSQEARENFKKLQQTRPNGATLSVDDVHEIRRLYEQDNISITEISKMLNIPRHNVYMIATYRRWANA
ncbi:MAG: GIY-YIG nuclease family protein [Lachnospiraceae bacterium]|nr:GIY-YIG nuclease family protein [Lachnospiraceae bacterium]